MSTPIRMMDTAAHATSRGESRRRYGRRSSDRRERLDSSLAGGIALLIALWSIYELTQIFR
jgi:hypothetical protein